MTKKINQLLYVALCGEWGEGRSRAHRRSASESRFGGWLSTKCAAQTHQGVRMRTFLKATKSKKIPRHVFRPWWARHGQAAGAQATAVALRVDGGEPRKAGRGLHPLHAESIWKKLR